MVTAKADPALGDATFARFRDLVADRSGLELRETHRPALERAVAQALTETGAPTAGALLHLLLDPLEGHRPLEAFLASLTIGETHFFRNSAQFEALGSTILPAVIAARQGERRLRIWSAGCASGEEPYSLAMLVDRLVPDRASWTVTILATDINPRAIEKARRGRYGRWSFREVPPEMERRYFRRAGEERELAARIREMVTFRYLNLVEDVYPSLLTNTVEMDLILCRNVLIYFREETTARIAERLGRCLASDGWLLVGHAEPSRAIADPWFEVVPFPGTIAYRPRDPAAAAPVGPVAPPVRPTPEAGSPSGRRIDRHSSPGPGPSRAYRTGRSASAGSVRRGGSVPPPAEVPAAARGGADALSAYRTAKDLASRLDLDAAEHWVGVAVARDPMFAPAHHLDALILQERGLPDSAQAALRRCVYADPTFVLGHFALGTLLRAGAQYARADKEFDNVVALLAGRPLDEPIPEGDGITVGRLLELVHVHRQLASEPG